MGIAMGVNNPRNVRHAIRQGWFVVDIPNSVFDSGQVSYMSLIFWARENTTAGFVSSFQPTCRFAFQSESDLAWFKLKWI